MTFTSEEKAIWDEALGFARKNKKAIARNLTNTERFPAEDNPVSVFMAGSPGAGKTETSIELIARLEESGTEILRIDPDELRHQFKQYTGENSWLFQGGVSILVESIHDFALKQKQSFLLDGTLSNYAKAESNVERSLKRGRVVQILYVYQEPMLAWNFVQEREVLEGRNIKTDDFIKQYFSARDVVNRLKTKFGAKIRVDLLLKNIDNTHRMYKAGVDKIDHHIPEKFTSEKLENLIK